MPVRDSEQEWEKLGKNDPYYGVVSMDKFRQGQMNDNAKTDFFKSGKDHIKFIIETVREQFGASFNPSRALDFGCGVGRCTIPLTEYCNSVVGLDVSESMLCEARKNTDQQKIKGIEYIHSAGEIAELEGKFDLIHSFIVFQHINPKKGERIFGEMLEKLNPGGITAVQFLYAREENPLIKALGWARIRIPFMHNFTNLLYGKPFREPLMEKNCYNLNRLFHIIHRHNCGKVHAMFQGKGRLRSILLFIQNEEGKVPYDLFYE